jgi:DNA-binding NarL/FixJ family response regulator
MVGATVLIVDDHRLFADVAASALKHWEPACSARSARRRRAVDAAATRRPDVVLLDLALPDAHGVDAGRTILDVLPGTDLLALSASTDPRAATEAVKAGSSGFLSKDARFRRSSRRSAERSMGER